MKSPIAAAGVAAFALLTLGRTASAQAFDITTCKYLAAGPVPLLIRGAHDQTILLRSPGTRCEIELPGRITASASRVNDVDVVLRSGDIELPATFSASDVSIKIERIPFSLEDKKTYEFLMERTGSSLGKVKLTVGTISVSEKLRISYDDQQLDILQDENSGTTPAGPIAVASRGDDIVNNAALVVPDGVTRVSNDTDYWAITTSTWSAVKFRNAKETAAPAGFRLGQIADIAFTVTRREVMPLRVQLQLRQDRGTVAHAPWFTLDLVLASQSRFESLPLPIATKMLVNCSNIHSRLLEIQAINDSALRDGSCKLIFGAEKQDLERYAIHGSQTFQVTVSRKNAKPRQAIWTTELKVGGAELTLFAPDDDDKGEGPYTVDVVIAHDAPQATYRPGSKRVLAAAGTSLIASDYQFSTQLRPRGPHATFRHWRFFVTIPVDVLALQFPASVRDLRTSEDNVHVQRLSLRTGLHFVLEPWDYAHARNRLPVPLRLVGGLSFISLKDTDMALVAGISAAIPLVDVPSGLASSISIAALAEWDLREPREGFRFLLTSSVNFFSLFGAQSGKE